MAAYDKSKTIQKIQEFLDITYENVHVLILHEQKQHLFIDFKKIARFDTELANALLEKPKEILELLTNRIKNSFVVENPNYKYKETFQVRITNLPESSRVALQKIRARDETNFISVEGVVKLKSSLINLITELTFSCPDCGNTFRIPQDVTETLKEPTRCKCGRKSNFPRLSEELTDFYYVDLEEPLDYIDDSNRPFIVRCWFKGGLADKNIFRNVLPGNKIRLNGYFEIKPKKNSKGKVMSVMEKYFEVNSVEFLQETFEDLQYTDQEISEFKKIANKPDWLDYLKSIIFKDIKGHDEECKAVILQMIGGVKTKRKTGKDIKGNLNVFLVGESGTSKSTILKIAQKFAPKAKYVAGSAVSGAGLIGAVVKNEFDGSWDVQAGALSLSNKGMLMIDELDKISHENKQALHEPLSEECYHPDTIITLANGKHVKIGDFVKRVFEKQKKELGDGLKLEVKNNIPSYSFSKECFEIMRIHYVSVYKSPEFLYEVGYSNGYKMKVTPNHPVFHYDSKKEIVTERADRVVPGLKVPFVSKITFEESKGVDLESYEEFNRYLREYTNIDVSIDDFKKLFPDKWSGDLAEVVGCFAQNGVLSNKVLRFDVNNKEMVERLSWYFNKLFDVEPIVKVVDSENYTVMVVDALMIEWWLFQFGSLVKTKDRWVPLKIFQCKDLAKRFLTGVIQRRQDMEFLNKNDEYFLLQLQNVFSLFGINTEIIKEEYDWFCLKFKKSIDFEVEIVSVKKMLSDVEFVYDVNIPLTHNFVSPGGVLLHNTISFSKAGVDQVLPAEVSVLAAANPKHSFWSKYDAFFEQIDMTTTLFNRFDLVFIFKEDPTDIAHHVELGKLILENSNPRDDEDLNETEYLFFKKYIAYAKTYKPSVPADVINYLSDLYANLKIQNSKSVNEGVKPIPITPRNMDSLRRLSQAVARSRFHKEVTLEDSKIAAGLLLYGLKKLGMHADLTENLIGVGKEMYLEDAVTGDMSRLNQRDLAGFIKHIILDYFEENKDGMKREDLRKVLEARGVNWSKANIIMEKMISEGSLIDLGNKGYRFY